MKLDVTKVYICPKHHRYIVTGPALLGKLAFCLNTSCTEVSRALTNNERKSERKKINHR